jgi:hypothetical protein
MNEIELTEIAQKAGLSTRCTQKQGKNRKTGHYPLKQENQEKQGKWGHCAGFIRTQGES